MCLLIQSPKTAKSKIEFYAKFGLFNFREKITMPESRCGLHWQFLAVAFLITLLNTLCHMRNNIFFMK